MSAPYQIQTKQKGAWLCWIGFRNPDGLSKHWPTFCKVNRCAARVVRIENGRVKVLAVKHKTEVRHGADALLRPLGGAA